MADVQELPKKAAGGGRPDRRCRACDKATETVMAFIFAEWYPFSPDSYHKESWGKLNKMYTAAEKTGRRVEMPWTAMAKVLRDEILGHYGMGSAPEFARLAVEAVVELADWQTVAETFSRLAFDRRADFVPPPVAETAPDGPAPF